jgi:hypothetical protein
MHIDRLEAMFLWLAGAMLVILAWRLLFPSSAWESNFQVSAVRLPGDLVMIQLAGQD